MDHSKPDSTPKGGKREKEEKKGKESQRKVIERTPLYKLPLRHRFMFNTVFKNEAILKEFLESLLGVKIEKIEVSTVDETEEIPTNPDTEAILSVETEKTVETAYGFKAVRFDVYVLGTQRIITIEMQASERVDDPLPQRSRNYQIALDRSLPASGHYKDIKDVYVIFVCNYDPYHGAQNDGFAKYTRVSYIKENNEPAEDGYHLIMLNTNYKDDDEHKNVPKEMLELLDYIRTDDDKAQCTGELAKLAIQGVLNARKDPRLESDYMSFMTYVEDEKRDSYDEGCGATRAQLDACFGLVSEGLSDQEIAERLNCNLSDIQENINIARKWTPKVNN